MEKDKDQVILIVDDDNDIRTFYTRALNNESYNVVCAGNGDEAIEIMKKENLKISLAVIDLLMPYRTGWELIEYIKKHSVYSNVPIIAVTGLESSSPEELSKIKTQCFSIIYKGDFSLDRFLKTVKDAVLQSGNIG
jgi:DNA-binding NtrC family response regulator